MANFSKFIEEDIEAKKTLFSTLPVNTKTNIRKFNEKISDVTNKYNTYKEALKKYIDTKAKSFEIKEVKNDIDKIKEKISNLEHVRFILNPTNTYLEKMGLGNLLYEISNYYDFNFSSLNRIINQFLDKFEQADIVLKSEDFDYTCYVNEYMISFLDVRRKKTDNYEKVSEIFERIYWVNPELINHIELNFRRLIRKHAKNFDNYISKIQKQVMSENDIINYADCLKTLKKAYNELDEADCESISDIIDKAKNNILDINYYFEDNKVRISNYSTLSIDSLNMTDNDAMHNFYVNIRKLKKNIEEYNNYIKFLPMFTSFKKQYEKQINIVDKNEGSKKKSKTISEQIEEKEARLDKINKRVLSNKTGFLDFKSENNLKRLKAESVRQAKELYQLYKEYDQKYFNKQVLEVLNKAMTISDLLNLYYSFDFFKKQAIKNNFQTTNYDEIIKYSEEFDMFAMDLSNVVVTGISVFEDTNIAKIITNKYRLSNINVMEDDLDNPSFLDKIKMLLRIETIEKSAFTVEKIWFITETFKIDKLTKKD